MFNLTKNSEFVSHQDSELLFWNLNQSYFVQKAELSIFYVSL